MEYTKPNDTMLDHMSSIIKQNEAILNMNHDIIKMISMPQISHPPLSNEDMRKMMTVD
jgi:hypothetical protein